MVTDAFERPLRDLRISVTDRCNFRCVYCMPRDEWKDRDYLDRSEILTYDEITRLARAAASLGVTKIRLTGGEPLLRRSLPTLVGQLSAIDGIDDVAMTTNGKLLPRHLDELVDAGLGRVTISLDAIDEEVMRRLADAEVSVAEILEAIDAAAEAGLGPIKVNTVVREGWNEDQVIPLVDHFRGSGVTVRFIEYMDVGTTNSWKLDDVVTSASLLEEIAAVWELEPVAPSYRGEVAARYRFVDGGGEVGFISSVSTPFCGDCSRLRLSADGSLYTCLFASDGTDIKTVLRSDASDGDIEALITEVWATREDRYSELRGAVPIDAPRVEMSYIGG